MVKAELIQLLTEKHAAFLEVFKPLSQVQFETSVQGKWAPGQHLNHIVRSVEPVVLAFKLPRFIPRLLFGKSNRPSKTYEGLVEKYQGKLAAGGRAMGRFIPKPTPITHREAQSIKIESLIKRLNTAIGKKSEAELDSLLLPHPLLGKLTLREMLYFTAYHAEHHTHLVQKQLQA